MSGGMVEDFAAQRTTICPLSPPLPPLPPRPPFDRKMEIFGGAGGPPDPPRPPVPPFARIFKFPILTRPASIVTL